MYLKVVFISKHEHKNRNLGIQSFQPVNVVARYPFPFPRSPHLKRVTFEKCSSLERRPSVLKPAFCVHLITKTEGLPASSLWLPLCGAMSRSVERERRSTPSPPARVQLIRTAGFRSGTVTPPRPLKSLRQHSKYRLSVKNLFIFSQTLTDAESLKNKL